MIGTRRAPRDHGGARAWAARANARARGRIWGVDRRVGAKIVATFNRRQFLAATIGVAGAAATGSWMIGSVWPQLASEDLVPGDATDIRLAPNAWSTTSDRTSFAVIGDNGSGGRQAMAVAERMARTYDRA